MRGHNRSLVPVGGTLVALDHDWHVGGIVPSVLLLAEIPQRVEDSFYGGKVCVTLKEKVFQPSSPSRHTTEIANVLQEYASVDVNLDVPISLLYSDGGPDHRVTFLSVKLALVALFIARFGCIVCSAMCSSWQLDQPCGKDHVFAKLSPAECCIRKRVYVRGIREAYQGKD